MTKILTVLARGLDNCGVTVNSIQFTNFVNTLDNYEATCVVNTDIVWGRKSNIKGNLIKLSFTKQYNDLENLVNQYDKIIFMCTPLVKSSDEIKQSFVDILYYAKKQGKFCAYCQFDHKIRSLRTNMYADPQYFHIWKQFDVIFNHSYNNDFIKKYIEPNNIEHNKIVCRGYDDIVNLFAIDFEDFRSRFWKSFEEKQHKTLKFIGRDANWKGPWLVRDIHYKYLKENNWITTIEGIGLTIGVLNDVYKKIKPIKIPRDDVNIEYIKPTIANVARINSGNIKFETNQGAYIMPPYSHDDAMDRLSKSQFGTELLLMPDYFCVDTIENAMFEIVAVGCVPVFRKQWADNFEILGKKLSDWSFEQNGIILLDENNPNEAIELMNTLSDDKIAYDSAREKAYMFMKTLFDVKPVYSKLLKEL